MLELVNLSKKDIITIDGPAASGKSTIGHLFSQKIGYDFVDSGSLYRAGSAYILKHNIDLNNEKKCEEAFKFLKEKFDNLKDQEAWNLFDDDIKPILHTQEINKIVPIIAARAPIRKIVKSIQRQIGEKFNLVMTGRDIGTEIFPEARLKFYLDCQPQVRAERRYEQLTLQNPSLTFDDVLRETLERDKLDMKRKVSPLRKPKGAITIDTSNLTIEETLNKLLSHF